MYLKIMSKGEMPIGALTLMGASTKRENPDTIGEFGTGNKYAIAYLLRNNFELTVFSGLTEMVFTTKPVPMGDHVFDQIFVNDQSTSLTTTLGKDWELWMAIRELYSNAVDEGLLYFDMVKTKIKGVEGKTAFYIPVNMELSELWLNIDDYIARGKKVLFENEHGKIYAKHSDKACIYRNGIRVHNTNDNSLFDYDFPTLDITEERLAKYNFQITEGIWKILYSCTDELIIRKVLNAEHDMMIEKCNQATFFSSYVNELSDTWFEIIKSYKICPFTFAEYVEDEEKPNTLMMANTLYTDLTSKFGEKINKPSRLTIAKGGSPFKYVELNETQQAEYLGVLDILDKCNFEIPYIIRFAEFKDKRIMGSASEEDTILISTRNFEEGDHYLINTIIEEYIHLKHGVYDETRAFQTAAINELVTYMKRSIK